MILELLVENFPDHVRSHDTYELFNVVIVDALVGIDEIQACNYFLQDSGRPRDHPQGSRRVWRRFYLIIFFYLFNKMCIMLCFFNIFFCRQSATTTFLGYRLAIVPGGCLHTMTPWPQGAAPSGLCPLQQRSVYCLVPGAPH